MLSLLRSFLFWLLDDGEEMSEEDEWWNANAP